MTTQSITQKEYEEIKATFTVYDLNIPSLITEYIKEHIEDLPTKVEAFTKVYTEEKDKQYYKDLNINGYNAYYKSVDAKNLIIIADEAIINADKDKALHIANAYLAIVNANDAAIKSNASIKLVDAIMIPLIEAKVKAYIEDSTAFNQFKLQTSFEVEMEFINEPSINAKVLNEVIDKEIAEKEKEIKMQILKEIIEEEKKKEDFKFIVSEIVFTMGLSNKAQDAIYIANKLKNNGSTLLEVQKATDDSYIAIANSKQATIKTEILVKEFTKKIVLLARKRVKTISVPTSVPTSLPISVPISVPTSVPTSLPISVPTSVPTSLPISVPTSLPISVPTSVPTSVPENNSFKYLIQNYYIYIILLFLFVAIIAAGFIATYMQSSNSKIKSEK